MKRVNLLLALSGACSVTFFAGCRTRGTNENLTVSISLTNGWRSAAADRALRNPAAERSPGWWAVFRDEQLSDLIEKALHGNWTLAEMRERIVEARARRGVISADRLPQVDLQGQYMHAETGPQAVTFEGQAPGQKADIHAIGAMARWEVDLWGRVTRQTQAAEAVIESTTESWRCAANSLAAELTVTYVRARSLEERLALLSNSIRNASNIVALAEARYSAGNGSRREAAWARRQFHYLKSLRSSLRHRLTAAENQLAILTGQMPTQLALRAGSMPEPPEIPAVGLPADLVTARADVRAAERRYTATVARLEAAETRRYPRLSLSGTFSVSTDGTEDLLDTDSKVVSIGPSLTFPLFTGGRIGANIRQRERQRSQALSHLHQVLLLAVQEVENAASGVARTRTRVDCLERSFEAARNNMDRAQELYDTGLTGKRAFLEQKAEMLAAKDDLLVAQQALLTHIVQLYRALGVSSWEPGL